MSVKIRSRHQSGLWSVGDQAVFDRNVAAMRKSKPKEAVKVSIVTRTEVTDQATQKAMKIDTSEWPVWHPNVIGMPGDCAIEWDRDFWKLQDKGLAKLTDFRVTTSGGHLNQPSSMPWVILQNLDDPKFELLVSTAHHNLDNTAPRAHAWLEEGANFRRFEKKMAARHRGLKRLHQADMNKNVRQDGERHMIQQHFLAETGLKMGWKPDRLPPGGTHGDAIIDVASSNLIASSKILSLMKPFDHHPIETLLH